MIPLEAEKLGIIFEVTNEAFNRFRVQDTGITECYEKKRKYPATDIVQTAARVKEIHKPNSNQIKKLKWKIVLILLFQANLMIGQINPINDLVFHQGYWYENHNCPSFNCFELFWSMPDASDDTLIGYNVYKNSQYLVFTQDTNVNCLGYAPCDFPDFYDLLPFWITVKAVYNSDSILSVANDSVHVNDLIIHIDEAKKNEITLLRNPVSIGENISVFIPNPQGEKCRIQVYSSDGKLVKTYQNEYITNEVISFSTNKMTHGFYVIAIQLNDKTIKKKLMIK